jgi:hypothetical protein
MPAITSSGNTQDVPVVPDAHVTYKPGTRRTAYVVRANPQPAPRPEPKKDKDER